VGGLTGIAGEEHAVADLLVHPAHHEVDVLGPRAARVRIALEEHRRARSAGGTEVLETRREAFADFRGCHPNIADDAPHQRQLVVEIHSCARSIRDANKLKHIRSVLTLYEAYCLQRSTR